MNWTRPDAYHTASDCGRYTVARVRVQGVDTYVAWCRKPEPAMELAASDPVQPTATDATRMAAIKAMQAVCERHVSEAASASRG